MPETEYIYPFQDPNIEYTMVKNLIFERVMPDLSGSGWKILCVAMRQTWGWVDDESPTGRKQSDRISYSQFLEKSGIKSPSTVSRAIKECLAKNYLLRHPASDHQQGYEYSLNTGYTLRKTATEIEVVLPETATEIVVVLPPKPLQKLETQKKRLKKRGKERGAPSSSKTPTRRQQVEHLIEH